MKKFLAGAALSALFASSALAQAYTPVSTDLMKVTGADGSYHDVLVTTETRALQLCAAATVAISGTGAGTSPSVTGNGCAMDITTGTSNAAATATITFSLAAPHGWVCSGQDITTNSTTVALLKQTANTSTTAVFRNYTDVMGTGTAWTDADHLYLQCNPY